MQVLCLSLPSLIHGYGCIARHKHSFLSGAVNGPCSDVCYISKQQRSLWIDSTNPNVEDWHQHSREKADKLKIWTKRSNVTAGASMTRSEPDLYESDSKQFEFDERHERDSINESRTKELEINCNSDQILEMAICRSV